MEGGRGWSEVWSAGGSVWRERVGEVDSSGR